MSSFHHQPPGRVPYKIWRMALCCTLLYAGIEWVGGYWTHALSLLSDAGHMLTDGMALGMAWLAAHLKHIWRRGKHQHKIEPACAALSALFMFGVVVFILFETYHRCQAPMPILSQPVIYMALGGLIINMVVARHLAPHTHNLNVQAAQLHIWADMLGSMAALLSGIIIQLWGLAWVDMVLSTLIALVVGALSMLMMRRSWQQLRSDPTLAAHDMPPLHAITPY